MINNIIKTTRKIQSNVLFYQKQYDELIQNIEVKKREIQSEASLKINDSILQNEISALEELSKVETESNALVDKFTSMNKTVLNFTHDANEVMIDLLKEQAIQSINNNKILDEENKLALSQKATHDLENLQDRLDRIFKSGELRWDEMNETSKNNLKKVSENLEELVSKTGDFTEEVSQKLIY
ncbi:hypothetical protein [Flammeovirga pacifica]|uniref:Uncharacterized protein n=1 Tax=Flammeovirga pacifica TaxID=915059 RepID=A0A1S1YUZ8_FLAPC|nr:hypothetical protein [Flammeovirga pacifica]OHX64847.1 hypothetical protein NH26_00070 [Flammeovirga pacifica]